jgi:hypothetical protein
VIFLAFEHFFSHFDGKANVAGGSAAAASVVVIVVEADMGGGGGTRDIIARCCVLCLGDGVLDEPGSGDFVDCELACGMIVESRL